MTKNIYLNLIMVLIFFITVNAQKYTLEPLDIFKLQYISNPQISPDGNSILYERNYKDIMTDSNYSNIWIVNYNGSNSRPITTGNKKYSQPTWSNDGKKILFKSRNDKATELYLYELEKKSLQMLTTVQSDISNLRWSIDDKKIIFLSFVEKRKNKLIELPEKPEGAKWNDSPIEITDLEFRSDGGGYLKKGNNQIF
ncbi:MAG: TolB family protein [Flavobacteriaceae bacterium]